MLAVFLVTHVLFSYFGFLHTDVDSSRILLNTLVNSESITDMDVQISLCFYMGTFAFQALILFIWNTFSACSSPLPS
jgi:hypothetical protein